MPAVLSLRSLFSTLAISVLLAGSIGCGGGETKKDDDGFVDTCAECTADQVCVSGVCMAKCTNSNQCLPDQKCNSLSVCETVAQAACHGATDCTTPPACYTAANATCREGACTYATKANNGTACTLAGGEAGACVAGACLPTSNQTCDENTDCGNNTCIDGLCHSLSDVGGPCDSSPDDNADCRDSFCSAGTCVECAENEQCPGFETGALTCIGNTCIPPAEIGFACDTDDDDDCANAAICLAGACVECAVNGDCSVGGETCIANDCLPKSAIGGECDVLAHAPDAGPDTADCATDLTCVHGSCLGGTGASCETNDQCTGTCIGGACANRAATSAACDAYDDGDCQVGEFCATTAGNTEGTCSTSSGTPMTAEQLCVLYNVHFANVSAIDSQYDGSSQPPADAVMCFEAPLLADSDLSAGTIQSICRPGTPGLKWAEELLAADGDTVNMNWQNAQDCLDGIYALRADTSLKQYEIPYTPEWQALMEGPCAMIALGLGGDDDPCTKARDCQPGFGCYTDEVHTPNHCIRPPRNGEKCLTVLYDYSDMGIGIIEDTYLPCDQGLFCDNNVCKKQLGANMPCVLSSACLSGECSETGVCTAPEAAPEPGTLAVGETCTDSSECAGFCVSCRPDGGGKANTCQVLGATGATCETWYDCLNDLGCDNGFCKKSPAGTHCGLQTMQIICDDTTVCAAAPVCATYTTESPCSADTDHCRWVAEDTTTTPPTPASCQAKVGECVLIPGEDEPCLQGECPSGMYCTGDDVCAATAAEGADCSIDGASNPIDGVNSPICDGCDTTGACSYMFCMPATNKCAAFPCQINEDCGTGKYCDMSGSDCEDASLTTAETCNAVEGCAWLAAAGRAASCTAVYPVCKTFGATCLDDSMCPADNFCNLSGAGCGAAETAEACTALPNCHLVESQFGTYCGQIEGTCAALIKAGQPCDGTSENLGADCYSGTCSPVTPDSENFVCEESSGCGADPTGGAGFLRYTFIFGSFLLAGRALRRRRNK